MYYEFLSLITDLSEEHDLVSPVTGQVQAGAVGAEVDTFEDNWVQLLVLQDGINPIKGWARKKGDDGKDRLKEVDSPPRLDFSLWAFVKGCVDAEIIVNANNGENDNTFFVTADYLLAWANIETNNNIGHRGDNSPPTDGVGPFQLSTQEWDAFLASSFGENYNEDNRLVAMDQILGAAFTARQAMVDISAAVEAHNGDTDHAHEDGNEQVEPYIPSYVDVLLAHFCGTQFAINCRKLKFEGKAGTTVDKVLEELYSAADTQAYIDDRKKFLMDDGSAATIDGMYVHANTILTKAFEKAFDQIKELAPEDAAVEYKDGSGAWYPEAEDQLKDWKDTLGNNEDTPAGMKRIREYFQEISFPVSATGKPPAWCGAFAGYCVKDTTGSLQNVSGPARAANWVDFGNVEISIGDKQPPVGAVVVLSPDKGSTSSGHVGFFSHYSDTDDNYVFLLGGNQGNTVQVSKFARTKIRAIRWTSPKKTEEDKKTGDVGDLTPGPLGPLLNFIGFYESKNNYNAYYAHANNQNDPEIVSKTTAQVQTFQQQLRNSGPSSATGKYQFMYNTLKDLISQGKVKTSDKFDSSTQDNLAVALLERRGLRSYLAGTMSTEDFALNLAKEWASMPVPYNVTRKGKTVKKGQSYYAGDSLNKALVPLDPFLKAIEAIK